jgi:ribose transport system ATP-binding protein
MRDIESGDITLGDAAYLPTSPQHAIASGISMVAGDRNGESLVTSMSVRENLFINPVNEGKSLCSYYQPKKEIGKAWWKVQLFDIRPKLVDIDVSALSGGNQQKVVMARWMHLETPILILEDPTAGVDVGARSEIYDLLNKALDMGIAIIVISTDFEEIAHICNRALVFNRGQVAGELMDNEVTFANLLALASGAQKQPSVNQRQSFNKTIAVNYEME